MSNHLFRLLFLSVFVQMNCFTLFLLLIFNLLIFHFFLLNLCFLNLFLNYRNFSHCFFFLFMIFNMIFNMILYNRLTLLLLLKLFICLMIAIWLSSFRLFTLFNYLFIISLLFCNFWFWVFGGWF
jgi:hypothetical protein